MKIISFALGLALIHGVFISAHALEPCLEPRTIAEAGDFARRDYERNASPLSFSSLVPALMPEWTDWVIDFNVSGVPLKQRVPVVCFYRVTFPRYIVRQGSVVAYGTSSMEEWIVAINYQTRDKYILLGSENPIMAFNSLIRSLQVTVSEPRTAVDIFDVFMGALNHRRLASPIPIPYDDMDLEAIALRDFHGRYLHKEPRVTFERWWDQLSPQLKASIAEPQAVPVKDGFDVQYFYYEEGTLSHRTMTVKRDGTMIAGESTILAHE